MEQKASYFIHIHIPKTAGSMFRSIVKANFGENSCIENPLLSDQIYSSQSIKRLFTLYPYTFLLGHVFRLRPCLQAIETYEEFRDMKLIAFIREPREKAISSYNYSKGRKMTNKSHPVMNNTFPAMVDIVCSGSSTPDSVPFDSSQLDWLVGGDSPSINEVESAISSGKLLMFAQSEFDLAMIILERLFPDHFKDCSYTERQNTSEAMLCVDKQQQTNHLSKAAQLPWVKQDNALYELAKRNTKELANKLYITNQDLQLAQRDFSYRCKPSRHDNPAVNRENHRKLSLLYRIRRRLFPGHT